MKQLSLNYCSVSSLFPHQIEVIASTWMERQKAGGEYSQRAASRNKHVVVCSSVLNVEAIMDFLNEFYAHPKLEVHMYCLKVFSDVPLDNHQWFLKLPLSYKSIPYFLLFCSFNVKMPWSDKLLDT